MSETVERAKQLAKLFHETYERLAPEFGYATRKETAVPWDEIPEGNSNKQLMIAVSRELLEASVVQPALLAADRVDAASLAKHLHEVIDDWRNSSRLHENEERVLLYVKSEITKWLERAAKTSTV